MVFSKRHVNLQYLVGNPFAVITASMPIMFVIVSNKVSNISTFLSLSLVHDINKTIVLKTIRICILGLEFIVFRG